MTDVFSPCRAILDRDPLLYFDLTETVRRGDGRLIYVCPTGALAAYSNYAKDGQDTGFTMFAADLPTAERLCALLPSSTEWLTVHEKFYAHLLRDRFGLQLGQACWQLCYPDGHPLPMPASAFEVRSLDLSHLPQVSAHYDATNEAYLVWLLERGELYGAFQGSALCGFIGRHAEGTIGLLEVLPQYRRRGAASLLQSFMTNLELSRGHIPYGQVFDGNGPSLALQRRLGFQRSASQLYWATRDE